MKRLWQEYHELYPGLAKPETYAEVRTKMGCKEGPQHQMRDVISFIGDGLRADSSGEDVKAFQAAQHEVSRLCPIVLDQAPQRLPVNLIENLGEDVAAGIHGPQSCCQRPANSNPSHSAFLASHFSSRVTKSQIAAQPDTRIRPFVKCPRETFHKLFLANPEGMPQVHSVLGGTAGSLANRSAARHFFCLMALHRWRSGQGTRTIPPRCHGLSASSSSSISSSMPSLICLERNGRRNP